MGTSQNYPGPSSKSPLEPEWLPSDIISNPDDVKGGELAPVKSADDLQLPVPDTLIPPKNRFKVPRLALNKFLSTGDKKQLLKSLSHYIRNSGGALVVARHHVAAIHAGAEIFARIAEFQKAIREEIKSGESAGDILERVIKEVGVKRGLLESENLIKILKKVIEDYQISFKTIDEDGKNFPWRDMLVDFLVEWIFLDYAQNIKFFESGSLHDRNSKEDEIKKLIEVYARNQIDGIEIENMSKDGLERFLNRSFEEIYQQLEYEEDYDGE